jgi:hypothetical protein
MRLSLGLPVKATSVDSVSNILVWMLYNSRECLFLHPPATLRTDCEGGPSHHGYLASPNGLLAVSSLSGSFETGHYRPPPPPGIIFSSTPLSRFCTLTWSLQAINWVMACNAPSRVNSLGPWNFSTIPSSFDWVFVFRPLLISCIFFQIGRGSAWWFSGRFLSLHRCW